MSLKSLYCCLLMMTGNRAERQANVFDFYVNLPLFEDVYE